MPARWASLCERSWMRRLASSMMRTSASAGDPAPTPASNDSTAISEATSPACAPPMPSATANSGARTKKLSSLPWRWRPRSDACHCSEILNMGFRPRTSQAKFCGRRCSSLEQELGVADPDLVARVQGLGAAHRLAVEVGPVGRAEVLEHDDLALGHEPRVARGGERVLQLDVGRLAAAEQ